MKIGSASVEMLNHSTPQVNLKPGCDRRCYRQAVSGVNPGEVLGSGPHQLFPLPGSAYWWTQAQFSQINVS